MKRRVTYTLAGAAIAAVLALGAAVGPALAYFTTYTAASGGAEVAVVPKPIIDETVSGLTKTIKIVNPQDSCACFVRVKIFFSTEAVVLKSISGDGWEKVSDESGEDCECWKYNTALQPGESTASGLVVEFEKNSSYTNDFNVVVVEEYTPALCNESGKLYANWNLAIQSGGTGGEDE